MSNSITDFYDSKNAYYNSVESKLPETHKTQKSNHSSKTSIFKRTIQLLQSGVK